MFKIKEPSNNSKIIDYVKSQSFPAGTTIRLCDITHDIQILVNNNLIKLYFKNSDLYHTVRGAFRYLVETNRLLKINSDSDGLYEVIISTNKW